MDASSQRSRRANAWRDSALTEVPCNAPLYAYRPLPGSPDNRLVFSKLKTWRDLPGIELPCGRCMACRLARAKDWSTRLGNEAQMHEKKCFVTLTYSDKNLPDDYSISVREVQLFMKRLRQKHTDKIRFFCVGEYGDKTQRPHYHLILFGCDFFEDRKLWRQGINGDLNYRSPLLETIWPWGFSEIGDVSPGNIGYVARYAVSKWYGETSKAHYTRIHPLTGQEVLVKPEFLTSSRKPGIGATFYAKYRDDIIGKDFIVMEGIKTTVPAYYLKLYAKETIHDAETGFFAPVDLIKHWRMARARERNERLPEEKSTIRYFTREEALQIKAERLKRELE